MTCFCLISNVDKTRFNEEQQVIWRDLLLPIPTDPSLKVEVSNEDGSPPPFILTGHLWILFQPFSIWNGFYKNVFNCIIFPSKNSNACVGTSHRKHLWTLLCQIRSCYKHFILQRGFAFLINGYDSFRSLWCLIPNLKPSFSSTLLSAWSEFFVNGFPPSGRSQASTGKQFPGDELKPGCCLSLSRWDVSGVLCWWSWARTIRTGPPTSPLWTWVHRHDNILHLSVGMRELYMQLSVSTNFLLCRWRRWCSGPATTTCWLSCRTPAQVTW